MANLPERGVVRSRELFKFWWAPAIYLERLKLESSNVVYTGRLYQVLAYG